MKKSMNPNCRRTLTLGHETIRCLSIAEIDRVAGGGLVNGPPVTTALSLCKPCTHPVVE